MRAKIRWCVNVEDIKENQLLRQNALVQKQINPYSEIKVPERVPELYQHTDYSFKIQNVIDYYIEPDEEQDIVVTLAPNKEMRFAYDPMVISKLELHFNGE